MDASDCTAGTDIISNGHDARLSRRSFLQWSSAATAALATPLFTEPLLAAAHQAKRPPMDAVMIDSNENPLGPCAAARQAVADIIPQGGRYLDRLTEDIVNTLAATEQVKPEQVAVYPGSSIPLHSAVMAFTSPKHAYVTADPGYEAGMFAAAFVGAPVVKTPLTSTYAHDVDAMLAAGNSAGMFYVCSPNNPTGTVTPPSEIERLVEGKPKGSVVVVDEAYIHFADVPSVMNLVKAGKDVVVLRTFSKLYGMAGLRCGAAFGRPDLLEKISSISGWNAMPITAVVAASASLKDARLVAERKQINTANRRATFEWLERQGFAHTPSQSNCFMLETRRSAKDVIAAMARQNVFIGRVWPAVPTQVRVSVGTAEEMQAFQAAFHKVMKEAVSARAYPISSPFAGHLDGVRWPGSTGLAGTSDDSHILG